MDSTPIPASLRTVLIVAAALLALVGVGGIATGAADSDGDDLTTAGGTTTTTQSATDSTLTTGSDATSTTAGGTVTTVKGTATTVKGGGTATTTPAADSNACNAPTGSGAAANTTAPALGIYSFVNCSDGSPGTEDKVEAGSSADGKLRRRVTASRDGLAVTQILSYVNGAVTLEGLEIISPYGTIKCDINPDVVITPAGLTTGKQWNGSGSCDAGPPVGKITFSGSGKVTGAKNVTIGGTQIQTWVLESDITVVAAGQNQKSKGVSYFDPVRGIDLYRLASTKDQNGVDQTITMRLASLTPRPVS